MRCDMGHSKSPRSRQHRRPGRVGSRNAVRIVHTFRPRLELLEDRVQPGDTLLGLSAVALWGLGSSSLNGSLALDSGAHDQGWHHGLFSGWAEGDSSCGEEFQSDGTGHEPSRGHAVTASAELAFRFVLPIFLEDEARAGPMARYRLADLALPLSW